MPEIAKHVVVVTDKKGKQRLYIDGQEFPWYVSEEGISTHTPKTGTGLPTASFTVLADKVEVRDERDD